MSTNISEFERTKPSVTYKLLNCLIEKYSLICADIEEMDDEDAITKKMSKDIINDLTEFKQVFLSGK
jgi:hypothetical protein